MEEMIKSILRVCNDGIKPSKGMFWISTSRPRKFPKSRARSTLTPEGLSARVGRLERGIGQFHADDQLGMRLGRAARQERGQENEDNSISQFELSTSPP
jgi:hypothetical protein